MARLRMKAWIVFEMVVIDDEDDEVELGEFMQVSDSPAGDDLEIALGGVTFTEDNPAAAIMFYDNLRTLGDGGDMESAMPYLVEDAKRMML